MMKSLRTTLTLMALFFGLLLALFGLERSGVYTVKERAMRDTRVLPDLIAVPEAKIDRVSIDRRGERLVFERQGRDGGLWQMVEPIGVAAEPSRLETLIRNLKELHRSPDSGTYQGGSAEFGFDPPAATVRLWAGAREATAADGGAPLAALEVGSVVRGGRFVRPGGSRALEIVDAKLLAALDSPASEWRDPVVIHMPTFLAWSVKVARPGQPAVRAERTPRGHWRLTAPVAAPADGAKVESLLAALSSLRVVDGANGFVADNVADFTPYGLAVPAVTVELTSNRPNLVPLVLHVGQAVPGHPDRAYVRRDDQDDVEIVDAKALSELPSSATGLRSRQVTEFEPALANRIEIASKTVCASLRKSPTGWEFTTASEKADAASVDALLSAVRGLQASEFFQPGQISNPELAPPFMSIKIWEGRLASAAAGASAGDAPAVSLELGRHDVLRKTIYGRIEHDDTILALPDTLSQALPKLPFPFRVRDLKTDAPETIERLTITRPGRVDELEPSAGGEPNRWRMKRPVDAPADTRSITEALTALSTLRAESFVTDSIADLKSFGLDTPALEVAWQSRGKGRGRLAIGSPVPKTPAVFAMLDHQSLVFTLGNDVVDRFLAEFHDNHIMSFPLDRAVRTVLKWPNRTVALRRRVLPAPGRLEWVDESESVKSGTDLSRVKALVTEMSKLETRRFVQYNGPIPEFTGLLRPRLVVEVTLGPAPGPATAAEPPQVLRIGNSDSGLVFVATGLSQSGPVFLLPAMAWDALIQSGERSDALPANPFAPAKR